MYDMFQTIARRALIAVGWLTQLTLARVTVPTGTDLPAPSVPIYYSYGGYPRISLNISWGTPAQNAIPAVFDLGSIGFWTYGPGAIINDGSLFLGFQGPCNYTVQEFFDWPKSSTHSSVIHLPNPDIYSYGDNNRIVHAPQLINDTMSFGHGSLSIRNVQVALSNFTLARQSDQHCALGADSFDQSIMGMGPFGIGGAAASSIGPSFRTNLYTQGQISSQILSVWMEKGPTDVRGTYRGKALFGEPLPTKVYSGKLVKIKQVPPTSGIYLGYYTAIIGVFANGKSITTSTLAVKNNYTNCLIDSGTGQDVLPINSSSLASVSRVFQYTSAEGFVLPAWNGTCESIPWSATLDYHIPGITKGKTAVVKVPVRSYVRGIADGISDVPKTVCPLSIQLDSPGCVLGAPFFTAAALQFDDDKREIMIGQGGVA